MRRALPALLLALLCVSAGCLQPNRAPSDQRALDTLNETSAAFDGVDTYHYSLDVTASATRGDEHRQTHLNGQGSVDRSAKRMQTVFDVEGTERRSYVDGYEVYTECGGMFGGYGRTNLSESEPWMAHTPAGRQLTLFDATNVYWRGTETVDDDEAALLVAHPTKKELQSVSPATETSQPDLQRAKLENVTLRLWVDTETHRPLKAKQVIVVKQNGATATASMTQRFSGYGDRVNTSIPAIPSDDVYEHGCPGS